MRLAESKKEIPTAKKSTGGFEQSVRIRKRGAYVTAEGTESLKAARGNRKKKGGDW